MPDKPNRRRKADEYAERDRAILRDAWRHQVLIAALVSKRFLGGKQAGHVLRRFEAKGWLALETAAIPGGVTYATLTAAGGREIGVAHRPRPMGAARLNASVAVAASCVLDAPEGAWRMRMTPQEVNALGGGFAANTPHVITNEFGGCADEELRPVVLRVQQAASGKPKTVRDKAAEFLDKALANDKTAPWVEAQEYGLVVLAHTPERVVQLKDVFAGDERFSGKRVVVGLGPTTETLATTLRRGTKQ